MGPLVRLASILMPESGRIYNESLEFGKKFPRHNDEGEGDAARHAYASALMAKRYGPTVAKLMGDMNEVLSLGQDRRSQEMDEYNNDVGYKLSDLNDEELRETIIGLLNEGSLKVRNKGSTSQNYAQGGLIQMQRVRNDG